MDRSSWYISSLNIEKHYQPAFFRLLRHKYFLTCTNILRMMLKCPIRYLHSWECYSRAPLNTILLYIIGENVVLSTIIVAYWSWSFFIQEIMVTQLSILWHIYSVLFKSTLCTPHIQVIISIRVSFLVC